MSGEIVVSETPNWLQELEAKRERRLKARLGHEAGAGAPCLKCGDKCPGLDLHFWRKCCKICKCSKEEHEVQDDDIYGWAQFQLLGSKPNKIKRKILLPGKKDEIDLEWVPKGHNDTIDKYLKTLPPEQLPVKGSQAAQDRKQLLQKQIPIHDIDPTLCHDLTDDELKQMNEYIAHVKQSSAGVGQIVSLSSIIKGKLHMLNPTEAAIIANRYGKGIPISEIVKLQAHNKTNKLGQSLDKMSLNNKNLPQFVPNVLNQTEDITNPLVSTKIHDKDYPLYSTDTNKPSPNVQFSTGLGPRQFKNVSNISNVQNQDPFDPSIDQKYLQNPNFDPKNRPSNFITLNTQHNHALHSLPPAKSPLDYNSEISAFVPYQKIATASKSGESSSENIGLVNPKFSKNLQEQYTIHGAEPKSPNFNNAHGLEQNEQLYENVRDLKKLPANLPNYAPGIYNTFAEVQSPSKIPRNVKDLAYSTYEPDKIDEVSDIKNEFKLGKYREPGSFSDDNSNIPKNSNGFKPIESGNYPNIPRTQYDIINQQIEPSNSNAPQSSLTELISGNISGYKAQFEPIRTNSHNSNTYPVNSSSLTSGDLSSITNIHNIEYPVSPSWKPGNQGSAPFETSTLPSYEEVISGDLGAKNIYNNVNIANEINNADPIKKYGQHKPIMGEGEEIYPTLNKYVSSPLKPSKQLSELHPSDLKINEDFLNPSQINIGLIQDINYPDIKTATHETGDFYEEYSPDSIKEIMNNVILPDCHYCKKPFEENEFAVTIDRANVLFHSGCFKCAGCNQLLADNVYFYNKETDNIYCLRDYAKIRGFPRCKACDELIFTKEYCLAENCTFHLKHFCCTECDMPLAGQDYTLEDEMPYCLPCFEQNKANKCNTCGKIIKPDELGCNLKGVHFHAVDVCFACKICKIPLMGKNYY